MNNNGRLTEPIGFHMEESKGDNHSLTGEELKEYLDSKKVEAQKAARLERKKYIYALLRANNVNPQGPPRWHRPPQ